MQNNRSNFNKCKKNPLKEKGKNEIKGKENKKTNQKLRKA